MGNVNHKEFFGDSYELIEYLKSEDRYFTHKELCGKFNISNSKLERKINFIKMYYPVRNVRGKGYYLIRWDEKTTKQEIKKIIKALDYELQSLRKLKEFIEKQIRPFELNKKALINNLKSMIEKPGEA